MSAHTTRVRVAAAVVWRDGKLLLIQRPPGATLALQWEMPGGKIEPGESPGEALSREVREELGVHATALEVLGTSAHDYPDGPAVEIVFMSCRLASFDFSPSPAAHAVRWEAPQSIDLDSVLAGDREFLVGLGAKR